MPGFAGILSPTRVIHMSLLVLAPTIAIAFKPKYLLLVLIPYFLFTSGFVFEVTQRPNIEQITIPYNYGMSNPRIDLGIGASITEDDFKARQYIYDNELWPVYSDIQGSNFMGSVVGWRSTWNRTFRTFRTEPDIPRPGASIFITSRIAQDNLFTDWYMAGCRKRVPPETYDVDIDNMHILFQSGDAKVLKVEETVLDK